MTLRTMLNKRLMALLIPLSLLCIPCHAQSAGGEITRKTPATSSARKRPKAAQPKSQAAPRPRKNTTPSRPSASRQRANAAQRAEQERLERERQERAEAQRAEQERLERERQERAEAQRAEQERLERERKERALVQRKPDAERIIQNLINNMVYVKGGTFKMGATKEQGKNAGDDEKPTHKVTLSGFYIGKYEVTTREWDAIMGTDSYVKGDNHPVNNVSWNDCQEFISKLNSFTGRSFRLPTEAEWEFAARGGIKSKGYKYSGSYNFNDVAWCESNSGGQTHDVGTKRPNELGLYDMSGNVWEWCSDWYGGYNNSSQTNPMGPYSGSNRVLRGGGWRSVARRCRSSYRDLNNPGSRFNGIGLRLVLSE